MPDGSSEAPERDLDWLGIPLLRRLARGQPVEPAELVAETGRPIEEVRQALDGQCDVEYDDQGRVVGNGITLRPTAHKFDVGGRLLYTWCALDTLVFPALLGTPANVESTCAATGATIRVEVEPDRIVRVEPASAVVSIVRATSGSGIRASFCDQVHFFADAEVARDWLAEHPDGQVVPVAEAQRLGRPIIQSLPVGGGSGGCCR